MVPASEKPVETSARHRRARGLEKVQVQLAAVGAAAIFYFLFAQGFVPWDPQAPITFLPLKAYGQAGAFVALLCGLAAACTLLTISSRPEGTLLAVLAGAGGVSLRSPGMRGLFWIRPEGPRGASLPLIAETLLFAAAVVLAAIIIDLVRGWIARARPHWVWSSPLEGLGPIAADKVGKSSFDRVVWYGGLPALFLNVFQGAVSTLGQKASRRMAGRAPRLRRTVEAVCCLGLGVLASLVLLVLLLRSSDRGQILFALAASFTVGLLVAHQVCPTSYSMAAWLAPMVTAVFLYALGSLAPIPGTPVGWVKVPLYARALPVDWLSAGAGGALLGYWISWRIHEMRILEKAGQRGMAGQA